MDKKQLREVLKTARDSLPKDVEVVFANNKTPVATTITEIEVGKGYGGTYFATLANGEIISTKSSEDVVSISMDGVLYNNEEEKKTYSSKINIDLTNAEKIFQQMKLLKKNDYVEVVSSEKRYNKTFLVTSVKELHAPILQMKLECETLVDKKNVSFMSRRDSAILKALTKVTAPSPTVETVVTGEFRGIDTGSSVEPVEMVTEEPTDRKSVV